MTASSSRRTQLLLILGVLALAVALRLWGLGSWQWEEDELYTLRDSISLVLSGDGSPGIGARPVYYLLQHALLAVGDPTPLFLRLPAFVFGVLGVAAAWWLGRRAFGRVAGLVTALLVAVSPWHLQASQFARYWTLVFLFAAIAITELPRALDRGTPRRLLGALAIMLLGALSHPTFLFPMIGAVIGLSLVKPDGEWTIRWPTLRSWLLLWGPFVVILLGYYLFIKSGGHGNALRNSDGRGVVASLRLIPAMIQWAPLPIAGASALSLGFLLFAGRPGDRRFALMSALGILSGVVILYFSSIVTAVYADYGIAVLPLVYLAIGGAVQRVADAVPTPMSPWVAGCAAAALGIAAAPGTVSHLVDGSRYDYRAAYAMIRDLAPNRPVVGGIETLQVAFEPSLETRSLGAVRRKQPPLTGFWFVTSYQRYGLREGGPRLAAWIDTNCRRLSAWERMRLDYRVYRVELHWCGTDPVPTPQGRE
ncbi:MAG: glycosyltransferase family 39 protein [Gemmatimonadales bacterium]